ncbi:FAD-dependent monooxygenase [Alteraurantiacibacter buctensis]|uniref:NAD(P)-binding protein n=1 Tax=Alteraurantiacibacter buctensis TaxID=1503981 RepID=A0A844YXW0_9SPHN|nr:FAD-dependent monooxygenase [Alteraurantiacibacter buctensis]MXO71800.1 NAD(P)-binding protein [Alteraurantiacibacter buctensis]
MTNERRVLIIGGGIGGMATAIALRKDGAAVDMVELDPEWKVYGAGLTITGPTLRAFRDLGLLDDIAEHGFFSKGGHLYLFNGTLLSETVSPSIEQGLPSSGGIMRPKLHEIMSERILGLGVNVRLGVTATDFQQDDDGVRVTFTDGSAHRYDLVVGADGIYSNIRAKLFENAVQPAYCGQMSWRIVAPRPPEMEVSSFFFGHENIAGIIPCSRDNVYAFILQPQPNPARVPDDQKVAIVGELLRDFGGPMAAIRASLGPDSSIVQRPFEFAFQERPWRTGRIILVGDAAHATTPHLASGAGIAVEDGLVLAEELRRADWNVGVALDAFTDRRYERCKFVVETSLAIARRELDGAPPQEIGVMMGQAMHRLAEAI